MRTQDQLINLIEQVIVANELDNNLAVAYEFSDPDGVRSGKSGWSFGRSQFDTQNNKLAPECLAKCGFDVTIIKGICAQSIDVKPLNAKLLAAKDVIDHYDAMQFRGLIVNTQAVLSRHAINVADDAAILSVADYANQYGLTDVDKPGYLVHYLSGLGRPMTCEDVLAFKLDYTKYGKTHPGDCKRRYLNLCRIMAEKA